MKVRKKTFLNWFGREDGAVTVEAVLWVPVYLFFFAFIVDVSLMFNSKTQVQRALQDVNRLASSGFFETDDFVVSEVDVETRVVASLSHLTERATVDTTFDADTFVITTYATIPAEDLMALGLIAKFIDLDLNFLAQHVVET